MADAEEKPTFVFKGTVKKLKAATMKNVPVDEQTAVVRVEQVIESPKNLAPFVGRDITVQLATSPKVAVGQAFIFHTVGWIFGDSIAVRAVTQEPVQATHAALLSRGGDPADHRASRQLQERVDSADLVVFGTVTAVRLPPPSTPLAHAARAGTPAPAGPVSEHDPKWREAVVEVDSVHKGRHAGDSVTVLFPASTDVRWFKAPKFEPGRQGFFVLHRTRMKESERVEPRVRGLLEPAAAQKEVEVYTALNPSDFQPSTQQERIRGLLGPAATAGE
jgi:hypothetical protein